MLTSMLTRVSAVFLGAAGVALLFAPDALLPMAGVPASAAWLGQLLAAALLALAALDWLNRDTLLGGIYGRTVVLPNAAFHFIGATSVLRAAADLRSGALWIVGMTLGLFAAAYAWLLFRGPLERDLAAYRRAQGHAG